MGGGAGMMRLGCKVDEVRVWVWRVKVQGWRRGGRLSQNEMWVEGRAALEPPLRGREEGGQPQGIAPTRWA